MIMPAAVALNPHGDGLVPLLLEVGNQEELLETTIDNLGDIFHT